jgi:hypothetical protein
VIGRKRISNDLRNLIFRMVAENSTSGAPRIHGELLMLGFDLARASDGKTETVKPPTSACQRIRFDAEGQGAPRVVD